MLKRLLNTLLMTILLTTGVVACSEASESTPTEAAPAVENQFEADTTFATEVATEPVAVNEDEATEPDEEMAAGVED